MYEYLIGKITGITPAYIVLENQGIGYQIAVGNPYRFKEQEEAKVYVQQVIREDTHILYGFKKLAEKQLFLRLISVSGIGPKSALAIMAGEEHTGMINAIESGDVTYLTKFPGVGKKTAQQMILDLKGKLGDLYDPQLNLELLPQSTGKIALTEAMEALAALGYSAKEVKKVEKTLANEEMQTTDEYLRAALKLVMKK